jgi:hypothetical protein
MKVRFCTLLVLTVACNTPTNGFDVDDLIAAGTGLQPGVIKLRDEAVGCRGREEFQLRLGLTPFAPPGCF